MPNMFFPFHATALTSLFLLIWIKSAESRTWPQDLPAAGNPTGLQGAGAYSETASSHTSRTAWLLRVLSSSGLAAMFQAAAAMSWRLPVRLISKIMRRTARLRLESSKSARVFGIQPTGQFAKIIHFALKVALA